MKDYSLPSYDKYRNWIKDARRNGQEWIKIKFGLKESYEELEEFLKMQKQINFWIINAEDWIKVVELEEEAENKTLDLKYKNEQGMLVDSDQESEVYVPTDEKSSWQLYRKHLLSEGFKEDVVNNIERTTIKILKRLNNNTVEMEPVKGLVIGNVQSGKTANMAALMAMAADWGWNMFIVLSGTIENLRQQTQNRLLKDLNRPGNISWRGLEHLAKKTLYGQRAQDLRFEEGASERYFNVCLKNSGRLKKLIEWLQADQNKQKQMRIIVIDDEADQAGINTSDINSNKERNTINRLIVNLVEGKNISGKDVTVKYRAMNYIGYTATPYANILNEASYESLYPRNFISTLPVSDEYFGPQQIFGVEGTEFDGLNIIREIDDDDLDIVKKIHAGNLASIPYTLKEAICWFIVGVATMRTWGYEKPISMLIHTSQKQECHENIAYAIQKWFKDSKRSYILDECEKIWQRETMKFTLQDFREQYSNYGRDDSKINKYPHFYIIKESIIELIDSALSYIRMGEDDELVYNKGIHLCVDNCKNSGVNEDGMFVRLAYPDSNKKLDFAPAFIVIGGATLSRGLTIEGLISTFFLRAVGQADTLMQMGRWFGYRKGYELLPRIWITNKTKEQFIFLSTLDKELRKEILHMDTLGSSPSKYRLKVKNTPKYSFIRITAKNKMQSAEETKLDYSGTNSQTTMFDNEIEVLKNNKLITEDFINSLGIPEKGDVENKCAKGTYIWRNVEFKKIYSGFLNKFKFCQRNKVFNDIESVNEWICKVTSEGKIGKWNVILSGKSIDDEFTNSWDFEFGKVGKITRTRKRDNKDEKLINIGVLRTPKDLVADVIYENLNENGKKLIDDYAPNKAKDIRDCANLEMTPQLTIYLIDKNSKTSTKNRNNLNAAEDIVGICMNVPGGKRGTTLAKAIAIKLDNTIFNSEDDEVEYS